MFTQSRNEGKVLKEIKFVLPEFDSEGVLREDLHMELEEVLFEKFGNCSVVASSLVMKDSVAKTLITDTTLNYEIVLEDSRVYIEEAKKIAVTYAKKLKQSFVYFKEASGEIVYLDVP